MLPGNRIKYGNNIKGDLRITMVIADFYIMCLSQTKRNIIETPGMLITSHSIPVKSKKILNDEYVFAQNLSGIWYSFEPKERETGDYSAEWFDLEIKNNQYVLIVNEKDKEKVLNTINQYIEFSPIKYIGILFRLQGGKKEKVKGVISKKQFIEMMVQNKIRYNCLYIVKK